MFLPIKSRYLHFFFSARSLVSASDHYEYSVHTYLNNTQTCLHYDEIHSMKGCLTRFHLTVIIVGKTAQEVIIS